MNVVRVDGWLTAEEIVELERTVGGLGPRIALDLIELRSADRAALEVLRALQQQGTELRNVPPIIALLLESSRKAKKR